MPLQGIHGIPLLIVDDERANCLLLKKIFEREGYETVITTTDPTRTADLVREHRPGIILLDINMPEMDGFAVMAQLQGQEGEDLAPVVILSAQGDQETRVRALQQGARDYVAKPFNQVELLTRVENTLVLQVAEQQRLHLASDFDPVTDLPNRDYALTLLSGLLEDSAPEDSRMAVAVLEIGSYQRLVQSFGYSVADACLLVCTQRLQAELFPFRQIMLGRLEGGCLLIGVQGKPAKGYTGLTDCAADILEALSGTVQLESIEVRPEPRLGAALFPLDADSVEGLLAKAQAALGQARDNPAEPLAFADAAANQQLRARLELEAELRNAVEREEFFVEYQPQYALADGRVCGAEALIRWQSPEKGRISPGEFIPALEATGLILQAGVWLIDEVFAQIATWREQDHTDLKVAINLSPRQIEAGNLPELLEQAVARHGIPAATVELEVTESLLLSGKESTRQVLEQAEAMGFSIALDDFGTGYSALSYLYNYPFHKLKIDRSFTAAMGHTTKGTPLVGGIIQLATNLGLVSVVEGIEESWQEELLKTMNGAVGQGFKFSKPLGVADFEGLLRASRERPVE